MALKIKPKPQAKQTIETSTGDLTNEQIVDRIVELDKDMGKIQSKIDAAIRPLQEAAAPFVKERKELEGILSKRTDDTTGDTESKTYQGSLGYHVTVGKKGMKREVTDKQKVFEYLGQEAFINASTVTLSVIDDYLTKPQREEVLEVTYPKARSVKLEVSE